MSAIFRRLQALEAAFQVQSIPTRDEWAAVWNTLSELDKAMYTWQSTNLEYIPDEDPYKEKAAAIAEYLQEWGLLGDNIELRGEKENV